MRDGRHNDEERRLLAIARSYRRRGYKVTVPRAEPTGLPGFLGGFMPDLIAESEGDRVVVEVKQSRAVVGSNELLSLAERIAREPGWRLELVTVPSPTDMAAPDVGNVGTLTAEARKAINLGLGDAAYALASMVLEILLIDLARKHKMAPLRKPLLQVARELVSRGAISRSGLSSIEWAIEFRNRMVHGSAKPMADDVERVLTLGQSLRDELSGAAA
jgi:hypothetical protein